MISIKTSREIDNMKKAGEIVAMAHKKIEKAILPGITTLQLDRIAYEIITGAGRRLRSWDMRVVREMITRRAYVLP